MQIPAKGHEIRFSGLTSLMPLAIGALAFGATKARLPLSSRLRRDIGLPEIEEFTAVANLPQRRI